MQFDNILVVFAWDDSCFSSFWAGISANKCYVITLGILIFSFGFCWIQEIGAGFCV